MKEFSNSDCLNKIISTLLPPALPRHSITRWFSGFATGVTQSSHSAFRATGNPLHQIVPSLLQAYEVHPPSVRRSVHGLPDISVHSLPKQVTLESAPLSEAASSTCSRPEAGSNLCPYFRKSRYSRSAPFRCRPRAAHPGRHVQRKIPVFKFPLHSGLQVTSSTSRPPCRSSTTPTSGGTASSRRSSTSCASRPPPLLTSSPSTLRARGARSRSSAPRGSWRATRWSGAT